jgi:glycerol-3-phosphate acyltransferase PlsX
LPHSPDVTTVAVDAMGGDAGPSAVMEGAVLAAADARTRLILVGDEPRLRGELTKYPAAREIRIVHAPTVVGMDESPSSVVRRRRDSSIWRATELVKAGEADAVVSAGHTGASMATAFFLLGTLQGVERPAIATILPTLKGAAVLLDVGANVDSKPQHLVQFAIMGHVYAQRMLNVPSPRVGLLSIGEEDTKGNELTKETFKLLKQTQVNFIGNVEGRDVYTGNADVVHRQRGLENQRRARRNDHAGPPARDHAVGRGPSGLPAAAARLPPVQAPRGLCGIRRRAAVGH